MRRAIGAFVVLGLIGGAIWIGWRSTGNPGIVNERGSAFVEETEGPQASPLPPPSRSFRDGISVVEVRRAILSAAADGDYDALRPLLEPTTFLSDFGYGVDPLDRWSKLGREPLDIMAVLLRMEHAEENSNEGRLMRWPTYDAKTKSLGDISARDRALFLSVMSPKEFRRLIPNEEYGYVGPRLGILENGTWWFFIMEPGP